MPIKRYTAEADNTITNAFEEDLKTRGTGSNMGASDILEVFSIYEQATTGSAELSRILVKFPVSEMITDRAASTIPASGSVNFFLRLYNASHSQTLPRNYELLISAITSSWQEGSGLDMEYYSDLTNDGIGSNWINRESDTLWGTIGGDYYTDNSSSFTQSFDTGVEDINIDITTLVEQWMNSAGNVLGTKTNYGVGIRLNDSYEAYYSSSTGANTASIIHNTSGARESYYTKKFFGRGSEFFFKKPVIEARWDSVKKDDRGNFFFSSSLVPATDNLNTIYLYNYVRGRLTNIPAIGEDKIYVSIFSGSAKNTEPTSSALSLVVDGTHVLTNSPTVVTGGYVSAGIYSASFAFTGSSDLTKFFDVWFSGSGTITDARTATNQYYTGSIEPDTLLGYGYTTSKKYVLSMPNLQKEYYNFQTARMRLYIREKNWSPSIYSKVNSHIPSSIIPSASYRVFRVSDGHEVISYGTGSTLAYTGISYDKSGSYYDIDMSLFEKDYLYGIKYAFKDENSGTYYEQPYTFKFKVVG